MTSWRRQTRSGDGDCRFQHRERAAKSRRHHGYFPLLRCLRATGEPHRDHAGMGHESRNLRDAMVARLASSTLRDRFSVDFNAETSHWEISFNKLSEAELNDIFAVPFRLVPDWGLGHNSEPGHRAIRIRGLIGSQAREFARAVTALFRIRGDSPLSNTSA